LTDYTKEQLLSFYETMVKIRIFEERVERLFLDGEIPGFVHLYIGQEAIATGVCANLRKDDYIESTHRGHGHTLAKGADLKGAMAEIFGKATGLCKGKGGSMHIADFSVGMLGANGVVGGGLNLAVGAALAIKMKNLDSVAVVFFGDGASNRGTFHEAMNMASVWELPIIFLNENNKWASTTPINTLTSVENISERAAGYSMPGITIDGNNVFEVYDTMREAVARARRGDGPTLIECKTYRIKGHFIGDPEMYRTKEEVQLEFEKNDPIKNYEEKILHKSSVSESELNAIREKVTKEIEEAVEFAKRSPYPEPIELYTDLYV